MALVLILYQSSKLRLAMHFHVALCAQRDEVQLGIVAGVAAKLLVMNFQVLHGPTRLTPPPVSTQNV